MTSENIPGPAYRIVTRRLVIRCWNPADAPLIKAAIDASVDHLRPWMPWVKDEPKPLQDKVELLRRFRSSFDLGQDFVYGILNRDETQVLGGTGLHTRVGEGAREIGYWIHVDHVNQGLATEVAAALTKVAFEVDKVERVEIHCDPENARSAAVPRKLGFVHEATLRQRGMIWTLLADEYPASPAAAAEIEAFNAMGRRIL
jgi:RimJ/RimL family protein N-acetyltransferase